MSKYPQFAQIKDKKYKINTDFRVALECDKLSNSDVSEEERALAIIFLLFGDDGLKYSEDWEELLQKAVLFLRAGKTVIESDEEDNMNYEQDARYIKTSFYSDYKIKDIYNIKYMHWWEFLDYLEGLTEDCILNRVRFIRDYDLSQIKDDKELEKWIKQKKQVELKINIVKASEEKRLDELFEQQMKGG